MKKIYNALSVMFCFAAGVYMYKGCNEQNGILFCVWFLAFLFNFMLIIENTKDE